MFEMGLFDETDKRKALENFSQNIFKLPLESMLKLL